MALLTIRVRFKNNPNCSKKPINWGSNWQETKKSSEKIECVSYIMFLYR